MSTQQPEWKTKPFQPGEIIEYCDDRFEVVENHGSSGIVKDVFGTDRYAFMWRAFGEDCVRVKQST